MSKTIRRTPTADRQARRAAIARMTPAESYYDALASALSRPKPYRAGAELRMRRAWKAMTPAERAVADAAWEGRTVAA